MSATREQDIINDFFPNDNTKTIEDVINILVNDFNCSRNEIVFALKNYYVLSDIKDWSI